MPPTSPTTLEPFKVLSKLSTKNDELSITPISMALRSLQTYSCFIPNKSFEFMPSGELIKKLENLLKNNRYCGVYIKFQRHGSERKGLIMPTVSHSVWSLFYLSDRFDVDKMTEGFKLPQTQSQVQENEGSVVLSPTQRSALLASPTKISYTKSDFLKQCSQWSSNHKFTKQQDLASLPPFTFENHPLTLSVPVLAPKPASETEQPSSQTNVELTNIDPQEFLASKYFTFLYTQSTPIQYFVKTTLPKVHILAHDNVELVKQSISKFILPTMNAFDKRHAGVSGIDTTHHTFIKEHLLNEIPFIEIDDDKEKADVENGEIKYRKAFLEKSSIFYKSDFQVEDLEKFLADWKIREAKLQVLLLLELLKLKKITSSPSKPTITTPVDNDDDKTKKVSDDHDSKVKTPAVKKPSLVRKKRLVGRKKRLVPTLLGTTIVADLQFTTDLRQDNKNAVAKQTAELTKADLETNIRLMFDRLSVWDAIGGVSPKDDDSSYMFFTSCVIPYYQKVHMKLLKELVKKVKGPSMSRKEKEERKKKKLEELKKQKKKAKELELAEATFDSRLNSGHGKTTSFFDKPRLQLSPMKVRRTASSLISQKQIDLSKKTFQMVSTASLSQLQSFNGADSQDQGSNSRASHSRSSHASTVNNGPIFTQRRVRKLGVAKQQQQPQSHHRHHHAHIQNPPKLSRASSTSSVVSSSPHKPEVEVEATPMKSTSRNNNKRRRDESPLRIDESPAKLLVSATPSKMQERQRRREVTLVSATPASKKQKKQSFVDNIHSDILSDEDDHHGKTQEDDNEDIPPTSPIYQTPVKQLGPSPIMMNETPIIANLSDDDEGEEDDDEDDDFIAKMPPSSPVLKVTRTKSSNVSRRLFDF
ncbi:unnamed protein product [Ambrosiozyma monospora]|uniref:Unnamed protein product n=1 Tax=Ambrosiozyma monospora TaxID=43982 RepID=A0ACB5SYF3_AMBMO|nr:unnamed protein product [Ambrosiozyma monospora]